MSCLSTMSQETSLVMKRDKDEGTTLEEIIRTTVSFSSSVEFDTRDESKEKIL